MNENINLYKILKGHEGKIFYCALTGERVSLSKVHENKIEFKTEESTTPIILWSNGSFMAQGECQIFPSKNQRDWIKWDRKNNNKTPKTWSEYMESEYYKWDEVYRSLSMQTNPIYKSMFAFLKIHQLIEVGYGGNPTYRNFCYNDVWNIVPMGYGNTLYFHISSCSGESETSHIAFHTKEQAKEFLREEENIELLKDYFMTDREIKHN